MNLILLTPDDFVNPDTVRLCDHRHTHIRTILRAEVGQSLQVGLREGHLGQGTVLEVSESHTDLSVILDTPPPPPPHLTLILALPRPKVLKRTLQTVTAMGIKQVYLLNSWRVDKSYWQSPLLQKDQLDRQLRLGLEQARDTHRPEVHLRQRFKPFVEDELPGLSTGSRAFLAHPYDATPCPADVADPTVLAIGPEGGFIPYEVEKFIAAGFQPVHIGPRALRVETAVSALLGRLMNTHGTL